MRIRLCMSRTAHDIIEIGRDLIETKKALGHGNFLPWIEAEFGMGYASASNFMNVAEEFGDRLLTVGASSPRSDGSYTLIPRRLLMRVTAQTVPIAAQIPQPTSNTREASIRWGCPDGGQAG